MPLPRCYGPQQGHSASNSLASFDITLCSYPLRGISVLQDETLEEAPLFTGKGCQNDG